MINKCIIKKNRERSPKNISINLNICPNNIIKTINIDIDR